MTEPPKTAHRERSKTSKPMSSLAGRLQNRSILSGISPGDANLPKSPDFASLIPGLSPQAAQPKPLVSLEKNTHTLPSKRHWTRD